MADENPTHRPVMRGSTSRWLPVCCVLAMALLPASTAPAATLAKLQLTGFASSCNVNSNGSCVKTDASTTWPTGQSFPVVYDLSQESGGVVPFTMPTLFFPDVDFFGGPDVFELFVKGTFDEPNHSVEITMNVVIERNGNDSVQNAFTLTTGANQSEFCNGIPMITLNGSPHDPDTDEISIVGNMCLNFAPPGGSANPQLLQVSLTGTLEAPSDAALSVPTLTEWGVMGLALLLAAAGVWWLRSSPSQHPAAP